jgi:hypothetical protein
MKIASLFFINRKNNYVRLVANLGYASVVLVVYSAKHKRDICANIPAPSSIFFAPNLVVS